MVINTSEEGSSRVLANVLAHEMTSTRMFILERGYIVNETSDENKRASLGLFLD